MNCKDCKHWGTGKRQRDWDEMHDDPEYERPEARICGRILLLGGPAMRSELLGAWPRRMPTSLLAYTLDASDYQADLWTAPTFACVLAEPAD